MTQDKQDCDCFFCTVIAPIIEAAGAFPTPDDVGAGEAPADEELTPVPAGALDPRPYPDVARPPISFAEMDFAMPDLNDKRWQSPAQTEEPSFEEANLVAQVATRTYNLLLPTIKNKVRSTVSNRLVQLTNGLGRVEQGLADHITVDRERYHALRQRVYELEHPDLSEDTIQAHSTDYIELQKKVQELSALVVDMSALNYSTVKTLEELRSKQREDYNRLANQANMNAEATRKGLDALADKMGERFEHNIT